ncbi:hypothetical protein [uncultured Ruminococcus sp.]|uniref:hypothetical protein n=1 Tax=uncultured Ruminococcus sp. TaxID=165186 RepID=UPI0025E23276|nr:hypothetical protein [uncultured Ruminococcus sp.]
MKKIALLLALCMVGTAVFCGCGSKGKEESSANESSVSQSAESSDTAQDDSAEVSVTGTWGISEIIDADGNSQTFEEYCQAQDVDPEQVGGKYTFNDDGSAICTVAGVDVEGSYEFDGSTLTLTTNGTSTPYTYNAEKGTLECTDANTGATSVFVKQ